MMMTMPMIRGAEVNSRQSIVELLKLDPVLLRLSSAHIMSIKIIIVIIMIIVMIIIITIMIIMITIMITIR